jgi:hypothetical protein
MMRGEVGDGGFFVAQKLIDPEAAAAQKLAKRKRRAEGAVRRRSELKRLRDAGHLVKNKRPRKGTGLEI